jgi:hypothetical protein
VWALRSNSNHCFLVTVAIIISPDFLFQTNNIFFYYLLLQRLLKRCGGIQPRTLGSDLGRHKIKQAK